MKKGIVLAVAVCLIGALALAQGSKPKNAVDGNSAKKTGDSRVVSGEKGSKLVAYYLHGTYRCPTCQSIERQAKETIEAVFSGELKSGKMEFQSLNFEVSPNEHFGTDYQLMTRSLVLSLRKNGKEVKWKNLPEIWSTVHTPDKFREYVSGEVKALLKEMK